MCCEKEHIHFCYEKLWKKQRDFSDTFLQTNPKPVKFFINISFTSDFIVYVFFSFLPSHLLLGTVLNNSERGVGGPQPTIVCFFFRFSTFGKHSFFFIPFFSLYTCCFADFVISADLFSIFFCCNCNNIICCLMCCCFLKYIFLFCCIVLQKVSKSCFFFFFSKWVCFPLVKYT